MKIMIIYPQDVVSPTCDGNMEVNPRPQMNNDDEANALDRLVGRAAPTASRLPPLNALARSRGNRWSICRWLLLLVLTLLHLGGPTHGSAAVVANAADHLPPLGRPGESRKRSPRERFGAIGVPRPVPRRAATLEAGGEELQKAAGGRRPEEKPKKRDDQPEESGKKPREGDDDREEKPKKREDDPGEFEKKPGERDDNQTNGNVLEHRRLAVGCRDLTASNFDDTASSHDDTLCEYPTPTPTPTTPDPGEGGGGDATTPSPTLPVSQQTSAMSEAEGGGESPTGKDADGKGTNKLGDGQTECPCEPGWNSGCRQKK